MASELYLHPRSVPRLFHVQFVVITVAPLSALSYMRIPWYGRLKFKPRNEASQRVHGGATDTYLRMWRFSARGT